jgi:hypothetical protein
LRKNRERNGGNGNDFRSGYELWLRLGICILDALLQRASEQVTDCYLQAADADDQANQASDPKLKADYSRLAETWRTLARSYEFQGSLGHFVSFNHERVRAMGQIEACVVEVIGIAQQLQDVDLAKRRIERLFDEAQGLVAKHFATAQRVWDQLMRASKDANGDCKQCLDQVMEWLHHDHLAAHRRTGCEIVPFRLGTYVTCLCHAAALRDFRELTHNGKRLHRTAAEGTTEGEPIHDYVVEDHADHVLATSRSNTRQSSGRARRLALLAPSAAAHSLAKVKVLDGELASATGQGPTAGAARYVAIDGRGSCLAPDHLVKGTAVRTGEEGEAPRSTHDNRPPAARCPTALPPDSHATNSGNDYERREHSVARRSFCGGAKALRYPAIDC